MSDEKYHGKKHSEWLIMVYLAGDNNLSAQSIQFLQELEAAKYDNHDVRVVAGFDSTTPWPKGARYLEIKRHLCPSTPYKKLKWSLHNDLVQPGHIVVYPDFCEKLKTPKPPDEPIAEEAFARFLDWVRRHYCAEKYILILFGHGTLVAGNTFLSDTNPPSYLKLAAFSQILRDHFGHKIDILGCDNCVMNGIETAVQLWGQVDFMIGSQGLMLANGWPVRQIIETVGKNHMYDPKHVADKILRVCARNILDFALMERSSEQAIIDVRQFGKYSDILWAVRGLTAHMKDGLIFDPQTKELVYPLVRDAIRLARLEAQSYWSETFVDLYDFVYLLWERCKEFTHYIKGDADVKRKLEEILKHIMDWCVAVLRIFRYEHLVPNAYYVCPRLQYSHGISVYFPWTLPEGPITFEPKDYWEDGQEPRDYYLRTPFEEYRTYLFADRHYGDWACFLKSFFRATLRNVRIYEHEVLPNAPRDGRVAARDLSLEHNAPVIDLQKSSSDTGEPDECECPSIKNYPRRFYLSPADCDRMMHVYGLNGDQPTEADAVIHPGKVSYLGWNIRGLLAEEVILPLAEENEQNSGDCH
jgi:hypothetical protein